MSRRLAASVFLLVALAASAASASVSWLNLDKEHHLCGRQASTGYLAGKVVMVFQWGVSIPESVEVLPRLEAIWQSFKGPHFVLLGGHSRKCGTKEQVERVVAEKGVTFPVYADVGLAGAMGVYGLPYVYVVDPTGRVCYRGKDERLATDAVVSLMAKWQTPRAEAEWRECLEFELLNLPARAIARHGEFAKVFPQAAAEYAPQVAVLKRLPGMTELLKLRQIASRVCAYPIKDEGERKLLRKRIATTVDRYSILKQSKDPQVAQEAKNALAELQWAAVER